MSRRANVKLIENDVAAAASYDWQGGQGMFTAEAGAWNAGTVRLQTQTLNGTWVDVGTDTTMSANGAAGFSLPAGKIRPLIAGATGVYAYAVGIPTNNGG